MKKNLLIILIIIAVIIIAVVIILSGSSGEKKADITIDVKKKDFKIEVTTTGELEAEKSEKIRGPSGFRNIYIWEVQIKDLIPEGTIVKQGDYVAKLDDSGVRDKLNEVEDNIQKFESQMIKTKLDTTIELRKARDELTNMEYELEEKELKLEQSKFEPPATIRQAEIDLDKTKRKFEQLEKNYHLQVKKSIASMHEAEANLSVFLRKKQSMEDILQGLTIYAPKDGMLIYEKTWRGKIETGGTIYTGDPVVAKLPDLGSLISKTFVNEIDISKIAEGQQVEIGVDAFPEMKYKGEITKVANIGQQLPNSDAKVFEVIIKVFNIDTILKPAMTTSNKILIDTCQDVISVPLDAVHSNDSVSYVYKNGSFSLVKQIIITGKSNENEIIIEEGLKEGDVVLLSIPDDPDNIEYEGLEIYEKEKEQKKTEKKESEKLSDTIPVNNKIIEPAVNQ